MKQYRAMLLLLALGMCFGLCATAYGYVDLARSATVVAADNHADYGPIHINNGQYLAFYYWTTNATFDGSDLAVELDWATPQTFDTVIVHFVNHPIAYQYYNNGNYGTTRYYHLQKETSPGVWEDIAVTNAVSDVDNGTPFAQFNIPGGITTNKVRVLDIFDLHEIVVWDRTNNLASSATVTAEFVDERPEYAPSSCIDNNFTTFYFPSLDNDLNLTNTAWLQFDWAAPQEFNYVRMYIFPHPTLSEGRLVSLQQEIAPDVWETIAETTTHREDGGFYQVADLYLPTNYTLDKVRLVGMFDCYEVDIRKISQTLLSGTVWGVDSNLISGATVSCSQGSYTTDCTTGAYSMVLNPGPIEFTVSAMGYSDLVQTVDVAGGTMNHDFTLDQDPDDLSWDANITASTELVDAYASFVKYGDSCYGWQAVGTPYGGTGLSYYGEWLQLEWPTNETIDTIQLASGNAAAPMFIEVWKDGNWQMVATEMSPSLPATIQFNPVQTTKLRLKNLWKLSEIAVYNKLGAVQEPNLTGVVTGSRTGGPVAGAQVEVGGVTCTTGANGAYSLRAPEGSGQINISRMGYEDYTSTVTVPSIGSAAKNAVMQTRNIAPLASSVLVSSEVPGCEAANCKDDLIDTLWLANESSGAWVEFEWASPVTVNQVKAHGGSVSSLVVEYWDGLGWMSTHNSYAAGVATFYPFTTTKIRVSGLTSAVELEVDESNVTPVAADIGQLKALPDGTPVQTTGVVTSTDGWLAAYVESSDKSSAIKVTPRMPGRTGENIAPTAIASASFDNGNPTYGPDKAIDGIYGNPSEYWPGWDLTFTAPNHVWVQLDWAAPQTFNEVSLFLGHHWLAYERISEVQQYNAGTGSWETIGTGRAAHLGFTAPATDADLAKTTIRFAEPVTLNQIRVVDFNDLFEIEVRLTDDAFMLDREVEIAGTLATDANGERYINAIPITMGAEKKLGALGMTGKALQGSGLNVSPLLVTVWGKVTAEIAYDNTTEYLYIDDGSGVASDLPGVAGVKFGPVARTLANEGDSVSATGIALYGAPHVVSPRSDDDLVVNDDVPGLVNIATEATATGSSTGTPEDPRLDVTRANDGSLVYCYDAGNPDNVTSNEDWLQLVWAGPQTVNQVVVYFHTWNTGAMVDRVCRLQQQVDGIWTDIATTTVSANENHYIARFVLASPVTLDQLRVVNMARLREIEVY